MGSDETMYSSISTPRPSCRLKLEIPKSTSTINKEAAEARGRRPQRDGTGARDLVELKPNILRRFARICAF